MPFAIYSLDTNINYSFKTKYYGNQGISSKSH